MTVEDLLREARRHHLWAMTHYLEVTCSRIVNGLLPYVSEEQAVRVELFDVLRRVFDVVDAETSAARAWPDVERMQRQNIRLVVKAADVDLVANVERVLQVTFRTGQNMTNWCRAAGAKLEVMNLLFDRRRLPLNFVPTGHMRISSTRIYFTGLDITKLTQKGLGMYGQGESPVSPKAVSQG